jgi:hypothetical protein
MVNKLMFFLTHDIHTVHGLSWFNGPDPENAVARKIHILVAYPGPDRDGKESKIHRGK